MTRSAKPWESDVKPRISELKESSEIIQNDSFIRENKKKFRFIEEKDHFYYEIFEEFENNYSQTYKGSMIELKENDDFELQVKFSKKDHMLFRRQTLDLTDEVYFSLNSPFKEQLFRQYHNLYSRDFNLKNFSSIKDDKKS